MKTLNVRLRLNNLHCYDEADSIGNAEPYLWTVFFKIDGDTTVLTPAFKLQGTAVVIGTPGNQRDLPDHSVDAGENVAIPSALGEFTTRLKPIPLQKPIGDTREVGGMVGIATVLLEQDNTPASAIAKGHVALDKAVRDALNALIPTLGFLHPEPSEEEIAALQSKVGDAVTGAISNGVSVWDWLGGVGNMDDKIGGEVFRFSHKVLEDRGVSGIGFQKRFRNEGDWELSGVVSAAPVDTATGSLRVALAGTGTAVIPLAVRVSGPGFIRSLNAAATLSGLVPGLYTVSASNFTTGSGKPTCKVFTPVQPTQQVVVNAGQTANLTVRYTSAPCDD